MSSRVAAFGGALEINNLGLTIADTGLHASTTGSFAGASVSADVDVRKRGFEIEGDQVRFAIAATNVNLGAAVQKLWGSRVPALVTNTIGSATFERMSSQNRRGELSREPRVS